jgi:branched-chain amino acid transport system ATP-binding protein
MIDLTDVHAGYGRIEVLRGVSLNVPRGTVTALLGPNGAGKSTLVKVLSGQLRASSGHVHLGGVHVKPWRRTCGSCAVTPLWSTSGSRS